MDGQAGARVLERAEERQAEDVIEVEVGQQRGGVQWGPKCPYLLEEDIPQRAQPGSKVDDQGLVPLNLDQET